MNPVEKKRKIEFIDLCDSEEDEPGCGRAELHGTDREHPVTLMDTSDEDDANADVEVTNASHTL